MHLFINDRLIDTLFLLDSKQEYISSETIANHMGVTSRTVRKDIKQLNEILKKFNMNIISKRGHGFKLCIHSKDEWQKIKRKLVGQSTVLKTNPITPEDRQRYIVKKILDSNGCIKIEQLIDELYVSESTIKNDVKSVKKILNNYNIRIFKNHMGIFAEGHEINKRFCISDYLIYRNSFDENVIADYLSGLSNNVSKTDFKKVKKIIINLLKTEDVIVADDVLTRILTHILISIYRVKSGKTINIPEEHLSHLKQKYEYELSKKIILSIENEYNLKLPDDEIAYVTLHFLSNRLGKKNEAIPPDLIMFLGENIYQLSIKITKKIGYKFQWLKLERDERLIYGLGLHLKELVTRLKYKMNSRNPFLKNIKIKYPLAFEAGVIAAKVVEDETGYKVGENEIGFLALHIGAALERLQLPSFNEKKKVALVCASGMATSELLLTKLSKILDEKYYMIGNYSLYQLNELLQQKPDIILTTVPIEQEISIPIVNVPTILDERDIPKLNDTLSSFGRKNMNFFQFLREDLFFPCLTTKTKKETLEYLTNVMIKKGYISKEIKDSIFEREQISATAIGNLVAIPHPLEIQTNQSVVCTGILKNKVNWAPNEDVMIVFIIILEEQLQPKFQEIFSSLYDILYSLENIEKLCIQTTFKEFMSTFESM